MYVYLVCVKKDKPLRLFNSFSPLDCYAKNSLNKRKDFLPAYDFSNWKC